MDNTEVDRWAGHGPRHSDHRRRNAQRTT